MNVGGIVDAGIAHGGPHGRGHHGRPAPCGQDARRQGGRVGAADCQRRLLDAVAFGALEHHPMRRHAALGAAGHDEADRGASLGRQMAAKQQVSAERAKPRVKSLTRPLPSVLPSTAMTPLRIDPARGDGRLDATHVVRGRCGDTMDLGDRHERRLLSSRVLRIGNAAVTARSSSCSAGPSEAFAAIPLRSRANRSSRIAG